MARAKKDTSATRRGSDEAIAKRKAARALNRLFEENGSAEGQVDGRTLKRKRRLLDELAQGRAGKPLKALEVLTHAHELLSLGESLSSLRRLKPKVPATPPNTEAAAAIYAETQQSYGFDPKAWKLLGVDLSALTAATSVEPGPKKASRRQKVTGRRRKKLSSARS